MDDIEQPSVSLMLMNIDNGVMNEANLMVLDDATKRKLSDLGVTWEYLMLYRNHIILKVPSDQVFLFKLTFSRVLIM
jgi:hypothetical protein